MRARPKPSRCPDPTAARARTVHPELTSRRVFSPHPTRITPQVAITAFTALPPVFEQTPSAEKELTPARELMEYAVLFSISQRDDAAAERNYNQLRPYYQDCAKILPLPPASASSSVSTCSASSCKTASRSFTPSSRWSRQRRRRIPRCNSRWRSRAISWRRAYGKIFAARASVPTPDYAHLMDMLAETVRDEIAACAEKAYTTLSRAAAAKLVGVSEAEMTSLAEARGWRLDATGGRTCSGRRRRRRPRRTSRPWSSSTRRCCTPRSWSASCERVPRAERLR